MEIRKTNKADDFVAIGRIYAESWRVAYKGIVPQDYLDGLSPERLSRRLIADMDGAYVLTENGEYIGTSSICAARDEAMAGWGEIMSIYFLPEYFGKGFAKPLLEFVENELEALGFKDIYLWVLEENHRARRFYEKCGFVYGGERQGITIAGAELPELRYVKALNK